MQKFKKNKGIGNRVSNFTNCGNNEVWNKVCKEVS
jgi:hypothetical protein